MYNREQLREKASKAIDKTGAIGPDIDLNEFDESSVPHSYMADEDLCAMPEDEQKRLIMAGLDVTKKERGGTYFQKDTEVIHCHTQQEGIEVIPIQKALEQYDWIRDYYWKLVAVDADKYTAAAELGLHDGYVIRALPGSKSIYPIQACLYLDKDGLQQNVHNIIIAEKDSELHIITGCATSPHLKRGVHVGISEFFVKKNATLTFTMIHNWAEEMMVRPRSVAQVEEGGLFLNNYICMKPVRSLQMYPTTHLVGKDAVARFYSIIVGSPGSEYDLGGRIFLKHPGNRAEIVSRVISNGGNIIARGHLIGEVPDIKAHLECRGLLLNGGLIHAIPELEGRVDGVEMSHEAAVGKIAQEEITYLMSRGLSEDEATSTIVRGFLNVDIPGLPPQLKAEIDRAIEDSDKDVM
ncbi:MAG: SufD family Fe-S cluster assembly protein [Deltaproteobacteria bacterium]|nr:SufD family Fe-S cluster assembly protein [Deltaproteobacteria bacterium]MBW1737716.1 SufD family Fe-S cluster assembly protein [Deltaproteobacteria bacterium]MBW1910853.1 SufD family Fe-S cluster assembly protein [Deltaproteobacteria bacterium]MBW2033305.1 SufD family Fe-S cluster assembly protein [Deltaproteobacteria bacterium]MBW2115223.1 SufD family Fe-S cluster assembly protein [Deltaproteobacteria bacterium]